MPDFVVLSETHLTTEEDENETEIAGYNQLSSRSNSKRTGGITIYFKKKWKVTKIAEKIMHSKMWISAYMVKNKSIKFIVAAVYRSPSSAEYEFVETFGQIVEEINETNYDIIIAGDFI